MAKEWSGQSNNNPERKSGITKVVNAGNKEQIILNEFEEVFNKQDIDKYDREKTGDELDMIRKINQKVMEFVPKFGGVPIAVNPENIHLTDISKIPNEVKKKFEGVVGFYKPMLQGLVIFPELKKDRVSFVKTLVHETLHLNSFQSAKMIHNEIEINRVGFSIYSRKNKKVFFYDLEEAIICELTVRLCSNFLSKDELNKVLKDYQYRLTPLWISMDNIYYKNKDKFSNSEEVFFEFAKISFTGKLKNIAKLIENTFGNGSLRKAANKTARDIKDEIETK